MKWKAGQQCAVQSYHWKERKKKPFRAIMWLIRSTITGKKFLKKDVRTLFWKYSFRHVDSQRSMPDAVNKFGRKLKEGIDPDANTR